MTFKPDIVTQNQIVDQVKGLIEQRYKLQVQEEQLERKLKLIETSLAENDHLTEKVNALLAESLALFEEEWKHRNEFYPDIWLASLEQAMNAVQSKKK